MNQAGESRKQRPVRHYGSSVPNELVRCVPTPQHPTPQHPTPQHPTPNTPTPQPEERLICCEPYGSNAEPELPAQYAFIEVHYIAGNINACPDSDGAVIRAYDPVTGLLACGIWVLVPLYARAQTASLSGRAFPRRLAFIIARMYWFRKTVRAVHKGFPHRRSAAHL